MKNEILEKKHRIGLGGVAIGTAFNDISDNEAHDILSSAWDEGIRYFGTSPWYGLTKSEKRFGEYLRSKKREDFVFSTKVGRLFKEVPKDQVPPTMWKNPFHYDFKHDYTADGIKRSIEDSLERTGLPYFDIIYVHDLSEDQVGDRYPYFLKQAQEGAFKVLSALRDEGVIKAWGMGVNKIEPILDCLDSADPDLCLSATQYSILEHEDAVDRLLPAVKKAGVKLVSGAGFNSGYLAGRKRYNYKDQIPKDIAEKYKKLQIIAEKHNVNLLDASIQFVLAAKEFVSIIPGAGKPEQAIANAKTLEVDIPSEFWNELKMESIIYDRAATPK